MKKVKWVVVGACGIADRRTIPGLMLAKNAELVAVMEINMELAEEALKDMIYPAKASALTSDYIIKMVAESFDVKQEDITSQKRNSDYVLPRQVVMFLCHDLMSMSYMNIAKILGKKDHTTIIHGVNKITSDLKNNEELARKVDIIRKKITG